MSVVHCPCTFLDHACDSSVLCAPKPLYSGVSSAAGDVSSYTVRKFGSPTSDENRRHDTNPGHPSRFGTWSVSLHRLNSSAFSSGIPIIANSNARDVESNTGRSELDVVGEYGVGISVYTCRSRRVHSLPGRFDSSVCRAP